MLALLRVLGKSCSRKTVLAGVNRIVCIKCWALIVFPGSTGGLCTWADPIFPAAFQCLSLCPSQSSAVQGHCGIQQVLSQCP